MINDMELPEDTEQRELKHPFTIFGEPIIKTRCQRNALISGISGGVIIGLMAFLFTSSPKKAFYIGFGGYNVITFSLACYCFYDELRMRRDERAIKKAIYEIQMSNKNKGLTEA